MSIDKRKMGDFESLLTQLGSGDPTAGARISDMVKGGSPAPVEERATSIPQGYPSPQGDSYLNRDFDDASSQGRSNVDDYLATSDYDVGDELDRGIQSIPSYYRDTLGREDTLQEVNSKTGQDLATEVAELSWGNFNPETATEDKNIFRSLILAEVDKSGDPELQSWAYRQVGTDAGEAKLYGLGLDIAANNKGASADLKQYYQGKGLLKPRAISSSTGSTLAIDPFLQRVDQETSSAIFADFIAGDPKAFRTTLNEYETENRINENPVIRQEVVKQTEKILQQFNEETRVAEDQLLNIRSQMIAGLSDYGEGQENYILVAMEPKNILTIKRMKEFENMPVELFLNALQVTGSSVQTQKAKEVWYNLGLTVPQQVVLRHAILNGVRTGLSGPTQKMAQTGDDKAKAEKAVLEYIDTLQVEYARVQEPWPPSTALILPKNLESEFLSNEFLLREGFKVKPENKSWWKKGLSAVYDMGHDLIGGVIAADEIYADNVAEQALINPHWDFDMSMQDDPYKQQARKQLFEEFRGDPVRLKKAVANARESGSSEATIKFLQAQEGLANVQQGFLTGIWWAIGGGYDTAKAVADYGLRKTVGSSFIKDNLPTWEQIEYTGEKLQNKNPLYNSWIDEFDELEQASVSASYAQLRDNRINESSKVGGKIRRDLSSVYLYKANAQEKQEIEDAIGGLFEFHTDANKQFHLTNAEHFNDLVLNKDYTIGEALDESINMWGRMRAGVAFGTFNLLDMGAGKVLGVGFKSTAMAVRAAPRLTSAGVNATNIIETLRGASRGLNDIDAAAVDDTIEVIQEALFKGDLSKKIDELTVVNLNPSSTKETVRALRNTLGAPFVAPAAKDVTPVVDAAKVKELSNNLGIRIFDNLRGTLTVGKGQLPKDIVDADRAAKLLRDALAVLYEAKTLGTPAILKNVEHIDEIYDIINRADTFVDAGRSFKNIFKITNPLSKANKLATMDTTVARTADKFSIEEVEHLKGVDGKELPDHPMKPRRSRMKQWLTGQTWEGARRDKATASSYIATGALGDMLTSYLPRFKKSASSTHHKFVLEFLQALQKIEDSPVDMLKFVRGAKISEVLYSDTAKTIDILREIDLDKLSVLKKGLDPTGDDLSIHEFWARFNDEIKGEMHGVILGKYGLTDEVGAALGLQNGINRFASKLFLERPAFAVRNYVTNKSLGILDGGITVLGDMLRNSDTYYQKVWGDIDYVQKGISEAALGTTTTGPVRGKGDIWWKTMIGLSNQKVRKAEGWRKALYMAKGGGIPFIGGGLPFVFAREMSGFAEALDRQRIIDKAGHRWYRQFASREAIERMMDGIDGGLRAKLTGLPDGIGDELFDNIVEVLQNPAIVTPDDYIQIIRAQTETADLILDMKNSPTAILKELGFHTDFYNDIGMDKILNDLLASIGNIRPPKGGAGVGGGYAVGPSTPIDTLRHSVEVKIADMLEQYHAIAVNAGMDVSDELDPHYLNAVRADLDDAYGGDAFTGSELYNDLSFSLVTLYDNLFDKFKTQLAKFDSYPYPRDVPRVGDNLVGATQAPLSEEQLKVAHDTAVTIMIEAAKPLRALEEAKTQLVLMFTEPDVYKERKYGFISQLTRDAVVPHKGAGVSQYDPHIEENLGWLPIQPNVDWIKDAEHENSKLAFEMVEKLIREASSTERRSLVPPTAARLQSTSINPSGSPVLNEFADPLTEAEQGAVETARKLVQEIKEDTVQNQPTLSLKHTDNRRRVAERLEKRLEASPTIKMKPSKKEQLVQSDLDEIATRQLADELTPAFEQPIKEGNVWVQQSQEYKDNVLHRTLLDIIEFSNDGVKRLLDPQKIRDKWLKQHKYLWTNAEINKGLNRLIDEGLIFGEVGAPGVRSGYVAIEGGRGFKKGASLTPEQVETKMGELGKALDILADRATRRSLEEADLNKIRKFADELQTASQDSIKNILRLTDTFGQVRSTNEAKKRSDELIETIIESFQGARRVDPDDSSKTFEGFVQTQVTKLNELAEELFIEPRALDLRKNGRSTSEANGLDVWHDQIGNYESNLAKTGPTLAVLHRLHARLVDDIANGVPQESFSASFLDRIDDWQRRQAVDWSNLFLDTELDAMLLRDPELVEKLKNFPPELLSPEHFIDKDNWINHINYWGVPQIRTTEADAFNFRLEQKILAGLGSETDTAKHTFSVPIQSRIIPRGQTAGLEGAQETRANILSPAQIEQTKSKEIGQDSRSPWKWRLPEMNKEGSRNFVFHGNEAVLPANYGMAPAAKVDPLKLEDVEIPPQGVHGRVFMQGAPEGYRPLITDDSWGVDGRRLAVFVRKDATEAEIVEAMKPLIKYKKDMAKHKRQIGKSVGMYTRGDHNWTGYQVSWSGSSGAKGHDPSFAQAELKKVLDEVQNLKDSNSKEYKGIMGIVTKSTKVVRNKDGKIITEAGDRVTRNQERQTRRRALLRLAHYMEDQWEKGWPIYGNPNYRLEDILEEFIASQKLFDKQRLATRGPRTILDNPSAGRVIPEEIGERLQAFMEEAGKQSNKLRRVSRQLGVAQADWILHDYNNTNNIDYMIRWLGPWHIWQTRTTAKLAAHIAENPQFLNKASQMLQTMTAINRDSEVSSWAERDLPVGQALQPFFGMSKAMGIDPGGWVSTAEKYSKNSTLNVNAFMFWNDMFDYYPSGGRTPREGEDPLKNWENFSATGKAMDMYSGKLMLPINPIFTAGISVLGEAGLIEKPFGEETDTLEKVVGSLTRPADTLLGLAAALTGTHHKTQLIRTNRDIREIDWQYANAALNIILTATDDEGNRYGSDPAENLELQRLLIAWDAWSRNKQSPIINVPLLHTVGSAMGEVFGHELSSVGKMTNPVTGKTINAGPVSDIHSKIVREAATFRSIRDATSILSGAPLNIAHQRVKDPETGRMVNASDVMSKYYEIVQDRSMTKGQKSKAYQEYFNKSPWVRNWLNNKKYESDPIKVAQATTMKYAVLEEANNFYEIELSQIPGERVPVPSSPDGEQESLFNSLGLTETAAPNEDFWKARTLAQERRRMRILEGSKRIFEATGINTGGLDDDSYGDPAANFSIDKRSFGDSKLFQELMQENLIRDDMFMTLFGDNPLAGVQRIEDVLDNLFPSGVYKTVKREDVETVIDEILKEKFERSGVKYKKEFITVDMFNAWQLESYVQFLKKERYTTIPRLFSDEFREIYTVRGTNATNWPQYYKDVEAWEKNVQDKDPEQFRLYKMYEASTADLDQIVDTAIEKVMRSIMDQISDTYELQGFNQDIVAVSKHNEYLRMNWKPPTRTDVLAWLNENEYGQIWMQRQDYSESELISQIDERLKTVDNITYQDMKDGQWEEKKTVLQTQISLETPVKEQTHFWSPNQEKTIYNQQTVDEFTLAYAVHRELAFARENNIYLKLNPIDNPAHLNYYKYFVRDAESQIVSFATIKTLQDKGKWDEAEYVKKLNEERHPTGWSLGVVQEKRNSLELPSQSDVNTPARLDLSSSSPEAANASGGFPSTGKNALNISRKYQLFDMGQNPVLSNEGANIKASIVSRYYGSSDVPIPADYIFETFARNGIGSREDIIDMWESMFPRLIGLFPELLDNRQVITLLANTNSNGIANENSKIATYQYVDALASIVALATGIQPINRRQIKNALPTTSFERPSATKSKVASPSSSGAGGLPTWAELTRHINMVFHDDELEQAIIGGFAGKPLTKNQERMLRAMYKTFPISPNYSFSEWLQALKLMYQTKTLLGGGGSSYGARSATFKYPSKIPRIAKYRE